MRSWGVLLVLVLVASPLYGEEKRLSQVHKDFDVSGIFMRDGTLKESIAVETLANIPSVVLHAGQAYPDSARITFGITEDCQCAKFRLFRVPQDQTIPPTEISYEAIRGFSEDNQTVEVLFEITDKKRLRLSVEVSAQLEPGRVLEWAKASEMMERLNAR